MAKFELIVIGTGSAGVSALEAAVGAGAKSVAVVEVAERLGGECPNRGCVPTKALLRSVGVLALARRAVEFGLEMPSPAADWPRIMERKRHIVDQLTGGGRIEGILEQLGVTLIRGRAVFTGPDEIEVGGERYTADHFIVAAGSEPAVPPIEGLKDAGFMTSDDLVELERPPASVVIIGGGPIGVESAQILRPLGVETTIVEFGPHLLGREDQEIAAVVEASFKKQGITLKTAYKMVSVMKDEGRLLATIVPAKGGAEEVLSVEAVLVAAGKRPALGGLALDKAGVELDKKGAPVLDEYLRSSNPAVYFAGDAAGQLLFTHVAHEQGVIAATNAVKGNTRKSDLSVVPRGTFCTPEVGSVGLTEKEARDKDFDVGVGKVPYSYFGKALVTGELEGLIKIVVDKKTGLVLGGHIAGESAAELVHELALAMAAGIRYQVIAEMIHAYPTFSEGIGAAASLVE